MWKTSCQGLLDEHANSGTRANAKKRPTYEETSCYYSPAVRGLMETSASSLILNTTKRTTGIEKLLVTFRPLNLGGSVVSLTRCSPTRCNLHPALFQSEALSPCECSGSKERKELELKNFW